MEEKRCINLDWLEVFCREPMNQPHNADYYRACGYIVRERAYGTRVYREMFVIEGTDGEPLLEVRRNPASQGLNGIHDPEETHLRLTNRTCYFDNAASAFAEFLRIHHYTEIRISRVDICLDFVRFDSGDDPAAFIRRYFKHRYAKINQGRITAHGDDTWNGQEWNSLSWGSLSSAVTTKMYDKTMELYDEHNSYYRKPYIRAAWQQCGLVDDYMHCTKDGLPVRVWRVEFSIRSAVKKWATISLDGKAKKYQSLRNELSVYDSRPKLLVMFASLSQHYFRFKKYEEGKRKDRCEDKVLFIWREVEPCYKVGRDDTTLGQGDVSQALLSRLIARLREYRETHIENNVRDACTIIINKIQQELYRYDAAKYWSSAEWEIMRQLFDLRVNNPALSWDAAMSIVKRELAITDRTIDVF